MLRWMHGHTRKDNIWNECNKESKIALVDEKITETHLRWLMWRVLGYSMFKRVKDQGKLWEKSYQAISS